MNAIRTSLKIWEIQNNLKGIYVAEVLEIDPSHWSLIKNGKKNPSMPLLDKFYEKFGNTEGAEDIYKLFINK